MFDFTIHLCQVQAVEAAGPVRAEVDSRQSDSLIIQIQIQYRLEIQIDTLKISIKEGS